MTELTLEKFKLNWMGIHPLKKSIYSKPLPQDQGIEKFFLPPKKQGDFFATRKISLKILWFIKGDLEGNFQLDEIPK